MMTKEEIIRKKEVRLFAILALLSILALGAALLYTGKISLVGMNILGIEDSTAYEQRVKWPFMESMSKDQIHIYQAEQNQNPENPNQS